jgi:hypothetical protein
MDTTAARIGQLAREIAHRCTPLAPAVAILVVTAVFVAAALAGLITWSGSETVVMAPFRWWSGG